MLDYDVFLSHSSKDKKIVREIAERMRKDGLRVWFDEWEIKPGDSIPSKIEDGLERSRQLLLFMSKNAFGSDWATLETQTFRFRDPLNKDRRFIPIRIDDTEPKGTLAQFLYVDLRDGPVGEGYEQLASNCLETRQTPDTSAPKEPEGAESWFNMGSSDDVWSVAISADGRTAIYGSNDSSVQVWDVWSGRCTAKLRGHKGAVYGVAISADGQTAVSGSTDKTVRIWDIASGRCKVKNQKCTVYRVAISADGRTAVSGSQDGNVCIWDVRRGSCRAVLKGHSDAVIGVAISPDGQTAISGSHDKTVRLWDITSSCCKATLEGHSGAIYCVAISSDGRTALSGSRDRTVRIWDLASGQCTAALEGHSDKVSGLAISPDGEIAFSASADHTVRVWAVKDGRCTAILGGYQDLVRGVSISVDSRLAVSVTSNGSMRVWRFDQPYVEKSEGPSAAMRADDLLYTNAKVLVVGDTGSGKTGLTGRLVTDKFTPSDSTVGTWSTQWKLPGLTDTSAVEREIWLWDFAGQADQRLIHQLYIDRSALVMLLFNADNEEVLPGLRDWHQALKRVVPTNARHFLVAGRTDAGFKAHRERVKTFAKENGYEYFETSAREGTGCEELRKAIQTGILWDQLEKRTSPVIYKAIKDAVLKLRDEGNALLTFKELRELLFNRLSPEMRFDDATLSTVITLLDGPGVVKDLGFGTFLLLRPEWLNLYAQAILRTVRAEGRELGCLPVRSIVEGKLEFRRAAADGNLVEQERLPAEQERVVLQAMEDCLIERSLCLRQDDELVFPSHCGRERPEIHDVPSVFVSYRFEGFLDDVYATLVVRLSHCGAFKFKEVWRDAADFLTIIKGKRIGVRLVREADGHGTMELYHEPGLSLEQQVVFANYAHEHLLAKDPDVVRLRHYLCPHCDHPVRDLEQARKRLDSTGKEASILCVKCEERVPLWDDMEELFCSDEVRQKVLVLEAFGARDLDTRRKGKLLVHEVSARITSADQKCHEIPGTEDEGIDIDVEFTTDGKGTAKHAYLQLKSGNSHLTRRKSDNAEIFAIKNQEWVKYWCAQPGPVMLVIGTFPEEGGRSRRDDRFAEVRWMEIRDLLRKESDNGKRKVSQIEFKGERVDIMSIRKLRDRVLAGEFAP